MRLCVSCLALVRFPSFIPLALFLTPRASPPPPHFSFSRQIGLDAFLPIRSTRPSNPKLTRHLLDDRPSRTRFPHQSKIFTPPDLSLTTYPIRIRTSSPHDRELVVLSSKPLFQSPGPPGGEFDEAEEGFWSEREGKSIWTRGRSPEGEREWEWESETR